MDLPNAKPLAMRWPDGWNDPAALDLLQETPFGTLLLDKTRPGLAAIAARAEAAGLRTSSPDTPPEGVRIVKAEWPGMRPPGRGSEAGAAISAGPTGEPWVDANAWLAAMWRAREPGKRVWVDAAPPQSVQPGGYGRTIADAASGGGGWIAALDPGLASGLRSRNGAALEKWKEIARSAAFFPGRGAWKDYAAAPRLGVVSDFSGDNEFLSQELLNMLARASQPCRIVERARLDESALKGVRAVVYPDGTPPDAGLRRKLLAWTAAGGLLVAALKWGSPEGTPTAESHPRFSFYPVGKGRIALAQGDMDAYLTVRDVPVLLSHRQDLVRIYNANAAIAYYAVAPGGRGLLQVVNYSGSSRTVSGPVTVRLAHPYRSAALITVEQPEPRSIEVRPKEGGSLALLPAVPVYAAVELKA
jgi:hypothetical protein